MMWLLCGLILIAAGMAYTIGRKRGAALQPDGAITFGTVHSLPVYHGLYVAFLTILPMLALMFIWASLMPELIAELSLTSLKPDHYPAAGFATEAMLRDIYLIANNPDMATAKLSLFPQAVIDAGHKYASLSYLSHLGLFIAMALAGLIGAVFACRKSAPQFRARNQVERIILGLLIGCSVVAILSTVGIVFSVLFETLKFFGEVPIFDFLLGTQWSPQTAIRADQVGSSGAFGIVPLIIGTMIIMIIAMCVAGPVGLFSAIYMSEYASPRQRAIVKPMLEILAGIPTVVFGFFAALTVAPFIRQMGESFGLTVASESALAAGIVMGVMIIPFMSSLSDDVINAVPQTLRDGSYALGATQSETMKKVILPAALPGIVSAFMLSVSRAVGETMIVVMAAGLAAHTVSWNLVETFNPLQAVTTVTVQIATLLVGDQEFDSAKTLSAFALGFMLFFFTLAMNIVALNVVKKYREQYD